MKPQGSSGPRPLRATWAALGMVACSVAVLTMYGPWQQGAMAWRGTVPTPAALPQQPCAANPAAAAAPGEVCELEGTQYACGTTAFDWKFYTEHYADLANLGATQAMLHWFQRGIGQGRRSHAGRKTLKILLMTKDEWPLLRSWVLYHADLVGGSNLYIIDGSTDPDAVAFLEQAQCQLGVHVFRSAANLSELAELMTRLLKSLTMAADFLLKLDTDEFLAVSQPVPGGQDGVRRAVIGGPVLDYLDGLQLTGGRRMSTSLWQWGIPPEKCAGDPALHKADAFEAIQRDENRRKAIFQAASFASVDLGSHGGRVREGFNKQPLDTDLVLIEFRYDCYDRWTANNRKAVLSHGYLSDHDSDEEALQKLEPLEDKAIPSRHKIKNYLGHLKDEQASRQAYYAHFASLRQIKYGALRTKLQQLHREFDARVRRGAACAGPRL